MSEAIENAIRQGNIKMIMEVVNEWESSGKSDFIEELLGFMTEEQQTRVNVCLQYNTPLSGEIK